MTPEEVAFNALAMVLNTNAYIGICEMGDLVVACAALEKQIPKKPVFESGSDEILQCQGCGADLAWTSSLKPKYRADYCERCGQAIDWTDWEK